jgi:ATP adenylyltransferase
MGYILMPKSEECILCEKPKEKEDESNHILYRGEHNFVILNYWPYNPGHLMVAPYRHIPSLEELSDEELWEHCDILRRCVRGIDRAFHPSGFNIGINIGKVAGAGIERHIHTHIVPRWEGDTNFMSVVSNTRVVPEALAATYQKLKGEI